MMMMMMMMTYLAAGSFLCLDSCYLLSTSMPYVWIGLRRCGRFRLFLAIILLIVLVLAGFVICFFVV